MATTRPFKRGDPGLGHRPMDDGRRSPTDAEWLRILARQGLHAAQIEVENKKLKEMAKPKERTYHMMLIMTSAETLDGRQRWRGTGMNPNPGGETRCSHLWDRSWHKIRTP